MTSLAVLLLLLAVSLPLSARSAQSSAPVFSESKNVTYCELARDPAAYNGELLRLTAFVTHGFEDFALADPGCNATSVHFSAWVMYGGRAQSGTVYCCPGEGGGKTRSEPLTVNGVQTPLVKDDEFQQFTDLLKRERSTVVRATIVGRFFSGKKETVKGATYWHGFGHMGCCSLFVIQQVEWFAPHERNDLDYSSDGGWYDMAGCKSDSFRYIKDVLISDPGENTSQAIVEQKLADSGPKAWEFDDPQRVALESLKPFYPDRSPSLRVVAKSTAKLVFRWRDGKKCVAVVVTRPYWLSFYAGSQSVVWVATNIKEVGSD